MIYKQFLIVTFIFVLLFNIGCTNNKDKKNNEIPANIVNNPISATGKENTNILPKFKFNETNHDFGVIIQGEKVAFTYRFTNVGGSDLIIANTTASCGCTVANYDKNPIKPNKDGKIEVVFDSNSKIGMQHKTVNIMANTQPNNVTLSFTAEIVIPK